MDEEEKLTLAILIKEMHMAFSKILFEIFNCIYTTFGES